MSTELLIRILGGFLSLVSLSVAMSAASDLNVEGGGGRAAAKFLFVALLTGVLVLVGYQRC
jgi:hypothetical protein